MERQGDPDGRPWLLALAQPQRERLSAIAQAYDPRTQMTYFGGPELGAAIDADKAPTTKKADRETGEDQKGF